MTYQLTRYERETNIIMNDDDDLARIITYQQRVITRLRKNPAAHETPDLALNRYGGAQFEIPAKLVSFRIPRVPRPLTDAQRAARKANVQKAIAARRNANHGTGS